MYVQANVEIPVNLNSKQKNILRDPFLFSCYTGTKLKIIEQLKWENIKKNTDMTYFLDIRYGNKKFKTIYIDHG